MAEFVQLDTNSVLRVTLLKRDGSIFDLTGYTVKLKYRIGNVSHAPVDMTILSATDGTAEFQFSQDVGPTTVVAGVNDSIDFTLGLGALAATVAPGVYTTGALTAAAVLAALQAAWAASVWGATFTDHFTLSNDTPVTFLFGTGVNVATSIHTFLGFNSVDTPHALSHEGEITGGLTEEGIMYAEIEVTETLTGLVSSSSEVLTFTVRGKVI